MDSTFVKSNIKKCGRLALVLDVLEKVIRIVAIEDLSEELKKVKNIGEIKNMKKKLIILISIPIILVVTIYGCNYKYSRSEDLIKAINNNNVAEVKSMIRKGYDVNQKDSPDMPVLEVSGKYPLVEACANGNLEIMKLLLDNGAIVNTNESFTPLETAISVDPEKNSVEKVKMLLQYGANVNFIGDSKYTALIYACECVPAGEEEKSYQICKMLIAKKADVNLQNQEGRTALIMASMSNCYKVMKLLLENGANANIKDITGKEALDYAKENNNTDIINLLNQYSK